MNAILLQWIRNHTIFFFQPWFGDIGKTTKTENEHLGKKPKIIIIIIMKMKIIKIKKVDELHEIVTLLMSFPTRHLDNLFLILWCTSTLSECCSKFKPLQIRPIFSAIKWCVELFVLQVKNHGSFAFKISTIDLFTFHWWRSKAHTIRTCYWNKTPYSNVGRTNNASHTIQLAQIGPNNV